MHSFLFLYNNNHDDVTNDREGHNNQEGGDLEPFFSTCETMVGTCRDQERRNCCGIQTCGVVHHSVSICPLMMGVRMVINHLFSIRYESFSLKKISQNVLLSLITLRLVVRFQNHSLCQIETCSKEITTEL